MASLDELLAIQQELDAPQAQTASLDELLAIQQELDKPKVALGRGQRRAVERREKREREAAIQASSQASGIPLARDLQEIGAAPELNRFSLESLATNLGVTSTFNDVEVGNILAERIPGTEILPDAEGQLVARFPEGGDFAINKQGLSGQDVAKLFGTIGAFLPSTKLAQAGTKGVQLSTKVLARRAAQGGAGAGATQAAIEAGQAQLGGQFDPQDIALATSFGVGGEFVIPFLGLVKNLVGQGISRVNAFRQAAKEFDVSDQRIASTIGGDDLSIVTEPVPGVEARATLGADDVTPQFSADDARQARATAVVDDADQAASDAFNKKADAIEEFSPGDQDVIPELQDYQEIAEAFRRQNTQKAALQVLPDAEILKAADELGIDVNPDAFSTNRAFIDFVQSLKSRPGSTIATKEQQAIQTLGQRADDLIIDLGGTTDKSLLDLEVRTQILDNVAELTRRSDELYTKIGKVIPATVKVKPLAARGYITKTLEKTGGNKNRLEGVEKELLDIIDENPTYFSLDRLRKKVGRGFQGQGVFKDEQEGTLKQVYKVLSEDQQGVADIFGVGADYILARRIIASRKGVEDTAVELFGRGLNKSIVKKLSLAATNLTKGDVSTFGNLMLAVPESHRQRAAASLLNDIFTQGARSDKSGVGAGFKNAFANLNRQTRAKGLLFDHLPKGARERFDRIGKVGTGIFKAKALENTSKTGRDVVAAMNDGSLFGRVYNIGGKAAAAEGVSSSLGFPGAGTLGVLGATLAKTRTPATELADKMIVSAKFKDAIVAATRGNKEPEKRLMQSTEFKKWLKTATPSEEERILTNGIIQFMLGNTGGQN